MGLCRNCRHPVDIRKPMLAEKIGVKDLDKIHYPVVVSPKLDGIRCIVLNGKALTRTFHEQPNRYVRQWLEENMPDGIDGELMVRNAKFNEVTSGIMSEDGEPDFYYAVFDYVAGDTKKPFQERLKDLREVMMKNDPHIWIVPQVVVNNPEEMRQFFQTALKDGFEGAVFRDPNSPYKSGRSTLREGYMIKLKPWEDSEAEIIGYTPLYHNANEAGQDAFGRTKRSHMLEGMEEMPRLGNLIVRDLKSGVEFEVGSGFSAEQRERYWMSRDKLKGQIITYKFIPIGIKEKPRFPIWKGFRSKLDID